MKNNKTTDKEVYSNTDLSDLLSSPVFYSVIALTFILGLSSIFGFLQNPQKLKTVVDVISSKVVSANHSNLVSYEGDKYALLQSSSNDVTADRVTRDRYDILSNDLSVASANNQAGIQRVTFNYDITSKQFWGSLDSSRIESAIEESKRQASDASLIGAPLSSDYNSAGQVGDSKYSMTAGILSL